MITLRPYQQECIDIINSKPPGRYLVQMITGLGKTVTMANIPRKGRVLLLSHREELVTQPRKYYDCSFGIELGKNHSHGEEVVSASVQTMIHRYQQFKPDEFDMVLVDECHHSAANSYKTLINYFKPRLLLGFTATPNRADNRKLNDVFDEIIFKRDIRWAIKNGYLTDIYCRRAYIGYDLTGVRTSCGDYAPGELDRAMQGTADAIAEAYRLYATGATLIFAVSVDQCRQIAEKIPGAVAVTGETPNRAAIIERFTRGEIPCIVNCMIFTEGTDIPRVETIIMARPTQSDSLYVQMVGRGLRLYPGKEKLNLIDCAGVTGRAHLCTAPTLLGIDDTNVPKERQKEIEGDLFDLEWKIDVACDTPESWIKNIKVVDIWAKEQKYDLRGVNWYRMPNGDMTVQLPDKIKYTVPCQDELGDTVFEGAQMPMQDALDKVYERLLTDHASAKAIWDLKTAKRWGSAPASEKQLEIIRKRCKTFDPTGITKLEASQILNRLMGGQKVGRSNQQRNPEKAKGGADPRSAKKANWQATETKRTAKAEEAPKTAKARNYIRNRVCGKLE